LDPKAFRPFIRVYSLLEIERFVNIKLTIHKALIRFITTYLCGSHTTTEIPAPAKED
jgi:hypothetical protein